MSRITELFKNNNDKKILNIYCTAGFPKLDDTISVIDALTKSGADLVEIGMPYSDPIADGSTIQKSNLTALQNGMSMQKLFRQLKDLRKTSPIPVVLMGYMNPVLQYGFERFCSDASQAGVDGVILPDLPEYEFESRYRQIVKKYSLDFIFLVTPETSPARVRQLDELSSGFLYAVSSSSTTGNEKDFSAVEKYLKRLQTMNLRNPILVGFGIKDATSFQSATQYAKGGVIGTAYIKALMDDPDHIEAVTENFINGIKAPQLN